jgi:hypothetical protein
MLRPANEAVVTKNVENILTPVNVMNIEDKLAPIRAAYTKNNVLNVDALIRSRPKLIAKTRTSGANIVTYAIGPVISVKNNAGIDETAYATTPVNANPAAINEYMPVMYDDSPVSYVDDNEFIFYSFKSCYLVII